MIYTDLNITCTSSGYLNKITLTKDDRHEICTSSSCKNITQDLFVNLHTEKSGIMATINHNYLNKNMEYLSDIFYKMTIDKLPAPNDKVVSTFLELKDYLKNLNIDLISYAPLEDGGLLLDYFSEKHYISLELYNDNSTSIYVEEKQSHNPVLMDDFKIQKTKEVVSRFS